MLSFVRLENRAQEEEQWVVIPSYLPLLILFLTISEEQKLQFGEQQAEAKDLLLGDNLISVLHCDVS